MDGTLAVIMTRMTMSWILCVWMLATLRLSGAEMTCEFPAFLQSPEKNGVLHPWNTRRWWLHLRHQPKWAEKQHIFVQGSFMWRRRDLSLKACHKAQRRRSYVLSPPDPNRCTERQLVYNRTCVSAQGDGKFRVLQYNSDRTHYFTCMRFVQRGSNIIQVYEGPLSESNDDYLCDDDRLTIDEWPWIAPWQHSVFYCPLRGGFTFRTIRRLTNEDFCEDEWRRSHLEIECVEGDGLHFITPSGAKCNPFDRHGHFKTLRCWAGWEEGNYIFLVAADRSEPKYCLRFPKNQEGRFSVLVYFSVICPTERDGKPPHGIEYYELRMQRKDPSVCQDEDELHCKAVAERNQCSRDKEFARHCPRSCGLCDGAELREAERPSCWFDPRLYGSWMLYEKGRAENVHIARDRISFSLQGDYFCTKLIDEAAYRYKTTLRFNNGCSERYTCFEFKKRLSNNLLQYRIGPGLRKDKDDDSICDSSDEEELPLPDSYYDTQFKNLILESGLWPSYCGLPALIPFNGTWEGERCEGQLGDWDPETCTTQNAITITPSSPSSCPGLLAQQEFQCLDFLHPDKDSPVHRLITLSKDDRNHFNCWVISSHLEGLQWGPRVLYRLPSPQCSLPSHHDRWPSQFRPLATLHLLDKQSTKTCKLDQQRDSTEVPSKPSNADYNVPSNSDKDDQSLVQLGSHEGPLADRSPPVPTTGPGNQGVSQSCPPSLFFLSFLAALVAMVSSHSTLALRWSSLLSDLPWSVLGYAEGR